MDVYNDRAGHYKDVSRKRDVFTGSPTMEHLTRALEEGTDIGDFGRLTFVMAGRHFMSQQELVNLLSRQPGIGEKQAWGLVNQVVEHDYSPPTREQLREWQSYQSFPIWPETVGLEACNLYAELKFPRYIFERVEPLLEKQAAR
jgi:hypothetical protein